MDVRAGGVTEMGCDLRATLVHCYGATGEVGDRQSAVDKHQRIGQPIGQPIS